MFQTWTLWGLLLIAMLFNSFYSSFTGQRQVKTDPTLKQIELWFAQRQQRWSLLCILIAAGTGYADWRFAHRGWFGICMSVSLVLTVALIGRVYTWHERMVRQLPDPPIGHDQQEGG